MVRLDDYMDIVDDRTIAEIYQKAMPLIGTDLVHINSTYYGGGVAEILKALVPLMNDVGLDAGWRVLHGYPEFFGITKSFHNALQGEADIDLSPVTTTIYSETNKEFSIYTHLNHDFVIIHDPQPLPLIKYNRKKQPWFWRCHIDLSNPHDGLWRMLRRYIIRYDEVIVSNDSYKNPDLPISQTIIFPAIDPLSPKNIDLTDDEVDSEMDRMGIGMDKPIVTQISRFDKWKDPLGVIDIYLKVKQRVDCRLILCGSMASDDPEGYRIYDAVKEKAAQHIERGDISIIVNEKATAVNALQRRSDVVLQKSLKEGFGLTATEAMWKGTPVIASKVGGLSIQIEDGENGCLLAPHDMDGFVDRTVKLLRDDEIRSRMGEKARETVRKRFLIPRLLLDYLNLLGKHVNKG
ncbi:MAG: glycosyltransferase [Candidatus Thermoplasmatota archaeon]|nr:glycosyltransferase [Candidatus Thermoplasmatota archaeon]